MASSITSSNFLQQSSTKTALAIGAVAGLFALAYPRFKTYLRMRRSERIPSKEEKLLRHVCARAAERDPASVLAVIDRYCWENQWMMNVGDEKGAILKREVIQRKPKIAVEIGAYCGYSAVLIASNLPADGHLYSIEFDPLHAAIATKIVEFAGLKDKVTILVGTVSTRLPTLQNFYKVKSIDLIFIDHEKSVYLSDFRLFEQAEMFAKGSVIVADNVIYPGAPDYLEYVRNNPHYRTETNHTNLEYDSTRKDAVEVSVRL